MDDEMIERLVVIQMKHNPQTKIGAAIVVVELLTAMHEPTKAMKEAMCAYKYLDGYKYGINLIIGD